MKHFKTIQNYYGKNYVVNSLSAFQGAFIRISDIIKAAFISDGGNMDNNPLEFTLHHTDPNLKTFTYKPTNHICSTWISSEILCDILGINTNINDLSYISSDSNYYLVKN